MVLCLVVLFVTVLPTGSAWRSPEGEITAFSAPLMQSIVPLIFLFFLNTIRRTGPLGFLRTIASKPELVMCFTYAIIFGFAVGFTAYNFGALVRFKIPGMPFLLVGLLIVNYLQTEQNKARAARHAPIVRKPPPQLARVSS